MKSGHFEDRFAAAGFELGGRGEAGGLAGQHGGQAGEHVGEVFLGIGATDRGLSYVIESSTTLDSGDWQAIEVETTLTAALGSEFERVSASLPATGERGFYRLRIELME